MLALVAALALSQASLEPSISEPARSASLFSSPRVSPGKLVGRVGMGLLIGSLVGGVLSGGVIIVGGTLSASGNAAPMVIATPVSALVLGAATAVGSALFSDDYGRDLLDAIVVSLACSVVSVAAVVALFYLAPATIALMVGVVSGLVFPAIATPLFVQAFKPGDPQPTIALATF